MPEQRSEELAPQPARLRGASEQQTVEEADWRARREAEQGAHGGVRPRPLSMASARPASAAIAMAEPRQMAIGTGKNPEASGLRLLRPRRREKADSRRCEAHENVNQFNTTQVK